MLVGYARVSTQDQDTALQLDALALAGCKTVYQEKASGASRRGREELARCLDALQAGDTLVVYKVDRIARSLLDLLDVLRHLEERGATIKSITEPLDTTNSMGVFVVQILGAVAELERAMIRERSMAGQRAAMARGKHCGRRRDLDSDDEAELVDAYLRGGVTYAELAGRYGVSESSAKRAVYRVTKPAAYRERCKV